MRLSEEDRLLVVPLPDYGKLQVFVQLGLTHLMKIRSSEDLKLAKSWRKVSSVNWTYEWAFLS